MVHSKTKPPLKMTSTQIRVFYGTDSLKLAFEFRMIKHAGIPSVCFGAT